MKKATILAFSDFDTERNKQAFNSCAQNLKNFTSNSKKIWTENTGQ